MEQRDRYFKNLAECDDVVYVSRQYNSDCMFKRNRWLINHSNFVLAVYNGSPKSGTAYTVQYAVSKHRALITINPDTFEVMPYTIVMDQK